MEICQQLNMIFFNIFLAQNFLAAKKAAAPK